MRVHRVGVDIDAGKAGEEMRDSSRLCIWSLVRLMCGRNFE